MLRHRFPYRTKSSFRCAPPGQKIPSPSSAPSIPQTHHRESSPYPAPGSELPPKTPAQTPQSAKRGFAKNTSRFRPLACASYTFSFLDARIAQQEDPTEISGRLVVRNRTSQVLELQMDDWRVYQDVSEARHKIEFTGVH